MKLTTLKINNFRCYAQAEFDFDQRINIFHGFNGSGKTSILEAIYFLSTGKSFRSKRNKNLIKQQSDALAVFARYEKQDNSDGQVGVTLTKQLKKSVKLNHQLINNQAEIAHLMPVVSIDPDSYLFLDKPPQFRRTFLDWLVFHVKHDYLTVWSKVSRCHKQLNHLYKEKQTTQINEWEQQYIQHANTLNQMRLSVFNLLEEKLLSKVGDFIPEITDFELEFSQGWSKEVGLGEQLQADRSKNLLYGNLLHGVHKMDIKNLTKNHVAHERLSRGQKKLISILYYLSYIELLCEENGVNPILCLDDMDAELDQEKTQILCDFIEQSQHQVFISTVDQTKLKTSLSEAALFHVEHQ